MILKKTAIASWVAGCLLAAFSGSFIYFSFGLFIGMLLFSLGEVVNNIHK